MSSKQNVINKKDAKELSLAFVILLLLLGGGWLGYKFFFGEKGIETNNSIDVSKIQNFGSTPQEALSKYIMLNGTMGNPNEVNGEKLLNKTAQENNFSRRQDAYKKSIEGLVDGSPIIVSNMGKYIKEYSDNLPWATYYTIDSKSLKVSDPSEPYELENTQTTGQQKPYKAVDVYASFISEKTYYRLKAQDASSDGTFVKLINKENFENIKFTLVEVSDKNWRIYDMNDEGKISSRFATWNPQTEENYDVEKDVKVGEIKQ